MPSLPTSQYGIAPQTDRETETEVEEEQEEEDCKNLAILVDDGNDPNSSVPVVSFCNSVIRAGGEGTRKKNRTISLIN